MLDDFTPRQIRAIDALNRRLIHQVAALIDELTRDARDAGIAEAPEVVTCGLEVALDYARRLRYQLDRHADRLTLPARLDGPRRSPCATTPRSSTTPRRTASPSAVPTAPAPTRPTRPLPPAARASAG